jgi:hypothetical protein
MASETKCEHEWVNVGCTAGTRCINCDRSAQDAIVALRAQLAAAEAARDAMKHWEDAPLPEDEVIRAAFPTRSGKHETYAEAMRLVGARHSKGQLVALVNWLLVARDAMRAEARDAALVDAAEAIGPLQLEPHHTTGWYTALVNAIAYIEALRRTAAPPPARAPSSGGGGSDG